MTGHALRPLTFFLTLLFVAEGTILATAWWRRPGRVGVVRGDASTKGPSSPIDSAEVDRFVQETLRRSGVPGAWLAIVKGDRVLHTAGYGRNADGSAVTPDTVMAIASLSKSFTAAAVMQQVVRGTVALDAPVTRYLPEFTPSDARAGRITVRQLLNHTSGLTFESLPGAHVRGRFPMHGSLEERVRWLSQATLRTEPGARAVYDNFGYEMLGRIVERASGQPFGDYLGDAVFLPLGMHDSRSFLTTRDPVTVPPGHTLMFGMPIQWNMPPDLVAGAGGVASSARDMARWLILQTTGGRTEQGHRLLPADVMQAMHDASSAEGDYGFGWRQGRLPDGTVYYHHSGRIVSYAAHEAVFPTQDLGYAFALNGLDPLPAGGSALIAGLNAIVTGQAAQPAGYGAAVVDHLVAVATVAALTVGLTGVLRSREWARCHAGRPVGWAVLRCIPYAAVLGAVLLGQALTVPWRVWWETWPPFAVGYLVTALAAAAILFSRGARFVVARQRPLTA